jgi:hypothetical protein
VAEHGKDIEMNAIVCFGTPNCLDDIKYLCGALRGPGQWDGDLITILVNSQEGCKDGEELKRKGMKVVYRTSNDHPYLGKYFIFDKEFKSYDQILYLDLDFLVLLNVNGLFEKYTKEDMYWDKTPFNLDVGLKKEWLEEKGIDSTRKIFQAAAILFKSRIIEDCTTIELTALTRSLKDVNIHNIEQAKGWSDEPIQNLYWEQYTKPENEIKGGHICFVGCRTPGTILAHTTNWHKPWQSPDYRGYYRQAMEAYNKI